MQVFFLIAASAAIFDPCGCRKRQPFYLYATIKTHEENIAILLVE
jgi:hypothetical protein